MHTFTCTLTNSKQRKGSNMRNGIPTKPDNHEKRLDERSRLDKLSLLSLAAQVNGYIMYKYINRFFFMY